MNISLTVSITLVFVGLMILAILLVVYVVHQLTKRSKLNEVLICCLIKIFVLLLLSFQHTIRVNGSYNVKHK